MPALDILVLNHLAERHLTVIRDVAPDSRITSCELAQAAEHINQADIVVAWGWMDIQPLYLQAPKLKWIHALSAGVENLLFPELQASHTILTNSRGIHGIPISEHVFALMLAFTRGLNFFIRQQTEHLWKRAQVEEIHDKTIGIVGLGSIGREIAKKAKAMGMHVIACKQNMTNELFVDALYPSEELAEVLKAADFVIASVPLVEETKELFRLEQFQQMKPTAYFINIARGGIVREADLVTALQTGLIRGAGLDVFEDEPLPAASPLWDMPNVIITPHLAALSPNYMDRAIKLFADNLHRFLQNKEMLNVIDKQRGY